MDNGKANYVVVYTQALKLWNVTEVIRRSLPEDKGIVFYPCVELWMASLGQTVIEPMFPGYVFIRSAMPRSELHEFLKIRRREVLAFLKELRVSQERAAGEDGFEDCLSDISDEEAELLDFMMGFRYGDSERNGYGDGQKGSGCIETTAGKTDGRKRIYRRRLPKIGVLAMSCGYRDADGSIVVMEGPLKGQSGRIVDVNPKERRAYLNLKIGGRRARVGLELKSKRYWFPNDKDAPVILEDGFEVNPKDIAAAIMRSKDRTGQLR